MTKSASLTRYAATIATSNNVKVTLGVSNYEWAGCIINECLATEEFYAIATVNCNLAGTRNDTNASYCVLSTTSALIDCFACH